MNYLTIGQIKQQCRIDSTYTADDDLLETYGDSAEEYLAAHLNCCLDTIAADNGGTLPQSLVNAMLIYVDYMYGMSGSGDTQPITNAYWILTNPYKVYSIA